MLLYCNKSLADKLKELKEDFLWMDPSTKIDDEYLRHLDTINPLTGKYPLIVATSDFGMRGFDYRAPKNGICLILAASFSNHRLMIQGFHRVGRYTDPCERIALQSVPLIDKVAYIKYMRTLIEF